MDIVVGIGIGVVASTLAAALVAIVVWIRGGFGNARAIMGHILRLHGVLVRSGITQFYENREAYRKRPGGHPLGQYLRLAQHSLTVVSIWLGYGVDTEGVVETIKGLVREPNRVQVTVSLLNPRCAGVTAIAPVFQMSAEELADRIRDSLRRFHSALGELGVEDRGRLKIKVHSVVPMGSAILIDPDRPYGRFQLESKVYKVPPQESFGFELRGNGKELYDRFVRAWMRLVEDSEEFDPVVHLVKED